MPTTTTHPEPHVLAAFARGSLPAAEIAAVAEHVAVCGSCCSALSRVPDDTLVGLAKQAGGHTPEASLPSFPAHIADTEPVPAELADHPRYKVLAELGAGGMGVVYKAEHKMMGRLVALKVMAPHLTAKASAVDRFHREVKAAAKLMHPNIVTAHDADSAGGLHFLVMEYVDGVSLDRLVRRRGPLAVTLAAQLARQVALGLQHAHEKDMVHRDIKPQNLMVSRKGQVKILDFGLARFARDTEVDGVKPQHTAANLLMGTPEYLSPEQAKNSHNVDSRSDIYSLGCTLYFLLTARVPFPDATTLIDKLLAHTQEEPVALRSIRPEVPEGLAAVVAKMMAKNPDDRYPTPADVAAALLPFTKEADPAALPATLPVTALPVVVPVVVTPVAETVNPFALDTEPDAPVVARHATPAEQRRPKLKSKTVGMSKSAKQLIAAGVAVLLLIVVAGIAKNPKKADPVTTAANEGGGEQINQPKVGSGTPPKKTDDVPTVTPPKKRNPFRDEDAVPTTGATGKQVLFVIPFSGVWVDDYWPVREVLEANGVKVVTASSRLGRAKPLPAEKNAQSVPIDVELSAEVDMSNYAAILFSGGETDEFTGFRPATAGVRAVMKQIYESDKPICAICKGITVLASSGLLANRNAASSQWVPKGPHPLVRWKSEGVVRDGRFITAGGPDDAKPFAQAVLKAIGSK